MFTTGKQQLLGSIYPELMVFEENELRTKRINSMVELVATFVKVYRGSKKKTSQLKTDLSHLVHGGATKSNQLNRFLAKIDELKHLEY